MNLVIDIGDTVVCDFCNTDYTHSDKSGGFIFGSYATCPTCAASIEEQAKAEGEERYIRARCKEGQSFADFVLEQRGGNNTVTITNFRV